MAIHINLPPEHPIMSFETIEIKMGPVSAKRSIDVHAVNHDINLNQLFFCDSYLV